MSYQYKDETFMPEITLRSADGGQSFRLIPGDSVSLVEKALAPGQADLIVTSPPYNIGVRYGKYDDSIPRREYLDWVDTWAGKLARVLAPSGSFFLNIGSRPSDPWVPFEVADVVRRHFKLQNVIHWIKSIVIDRECFPGREKGGDDLIMGHYKPIRSKRFLSDLHEYVFHWTATGSVELDRLALGVAYKDKSNVSRWKTPRLRGDLRCRGNVWFVPYETIQNRSAERPHPSTFPVRLARMCIRLSLLRRAHSAEAASAAKAGSGCEGRTGRERTRVVLDPFMGIGNTALACLREGASFIGIDLDEGYLGEAERRLRREMSGL